MIDDDDSKTPGFDIVSPKTFIGSDGYGVWLKKCEEAELCVQDRRAGLLLVCTYIVATVSVVLFKYLS